MSKWFKVQTPVHSTAAGPRALLYNEDRSEYAEVEGNAAQSIIEALGMSTGDKVYVKATINKRGKFVVNKDTITREEMF